MAKTDWSLIDTVLPQDMNDIGTEINSNIIENIGYGVHAGLDTLASATADMNVHVQSGVIYMPDGQRFQFDSVTTIAITAADATNPRKDIIFVDSAGVITYLAGVADPAPTKPSLPSGAVELREIDVPASDTSIEQAQLIDTRIFKENLPDVNQKVNEHLADAMPHQFVDGATTYRYGFKLNATNDGLVFVYEEVI